MLDRKSIEIVHTDVYTISMEFEWDPQKNKTNIEKHGIDFHDAFQVFCRPMLKKIDGREDYGEERWIALGELDGAVVVMVYTHRSQKTRIISIRRANRHEREIYEEKRNKSDKQEKIA